MDKVTGEVKIPPVPFKPLKVDDFRLQELMGNLKTLPHVEPRRWAGVDPAFPGGDRAALTLGEKKGKKTRYFFIFDEAGHWPVYKWWRNPIKAYKWNKLLRTMNKATGRTK